MSENSVNPYVGLRPFQMDEDLLFFGRDKQVLEILQRLHTHPFLAVVGGSGSGKSSLIRAGLIPALIGGYLVEDSSKWKIAIMKPGQNPMFNFAESILKQINPVVTNKQINDFLTQIKKEGITAIIERFTPLKETQRFNYFLLIDQFEELFRYQMDASATEGKTEAIDFVNTILNLTAQGSFPFYIVLTMRSDFIGDCAQFHGLPEALNKSQYLVPRLNREEMKRVIEGPAKLYGKKFSPALTSKLLNDTTKVKDELPLLQHVLMRIWDYEAKIDKSGELDLKDYKAIGGIEKALSLHADEALKSLNQEDQKIAKVLFQALTEIDENGRKIRRPLLFKDLKELSGATEKHLLDIIDHFIRDKRSFLIMEHAGKEGDQLIDISHESLIRQWDTLNQWVVDEAEFADNYKQLDEARRLFDNKRKDLLSGSELLLTLEWFNKFQPKAVWANRYKEGFEESKAYLLESEKQAKRKLIKNRLYLYGFISLLMLFIAFFAWYGWRENSRNDAFRLHFASQNILDKDPTLALQGEILAFTKFKDSGFIKAQEDIYDKNSIYTITTKIPIDSIVLFKTDKTGQYIVTADSLGGAKIYDKTGMLIEQFKLPPNSLNYITAMVFIDHGLKLLIGDRNGYVFTYDLNGKKLEKIYGKTNGDIKIGTIKGLSFNDSTETIKLYTGSGYVHSSNMKNWTVYPYLDIIRAIIFSDNDDLAIFSNEDFAVTNLENSILSTDQQFINPVYLNDNHQPLNGTVLSADFSNGKNPLLLMGFRENSVAIWNQNTKELKPFNGQRDAVNFVSFVPTNNDYFFIGTSDNVLSLLDSNGVLVQEFIGHTDRIYHIQMRDDNTVESYSYDGTIRKWKIKEPMKVSKSLFDSEKIIHVIWPHNGNEIIAISNTEAKKWNLGSESQKISSLFNNLNFDFYYPKTFVMTPDGKSFFMGFYNKTGYLVDRNGTIKTKFEHDDNGINSVAISQDGERIVTASGSKVYLWDKDGNLLMKYKEHKGRVRSVAISEDNNFIVSGSEDNTTKLWSTIGNNSALWSIESNNLVSTVAFSPVSNQIITGSFDKRVFLIDANDPKSNKQLKGYSESVSNVIYGKKHIVAIYLNGTAIIWDSSGNKIIKELNDNSYRIQCASFNSSENQIVTGDDKGLIRFWDLTPIESLKEFLESDSFKMHPDKEIIERLESFNKK